MKPPARLQPLIEEGLIDTVVRQLMSGKEAMVYVVRSGDETRCAKIYKEANNRSFRQAVDYTENRKVKNSRQARAMAKGTKFGREAQEAAWQSAEVDALYRLAWTRGLKTTYYLRSRSATHVEKSTLRGTDGKLNAVAAAPVLSAGAPIIMPSAVTAPDLSGAVACSIDNPECEACQ